MNKYTKIFDPQSLIGRQVWRQSGATGVFKIIEIKEVASDNLKMKIGTDTFSMTESFTIKDLIDLSKGKIVKDLELLKETKMKKGGSVENTDWKIGGLGQKYTYYKLGTIHLKDDGSYMVRYGVNEAPTGAKTLIEAKKQLDKYTESKTAKGKEVEGKSSYEAMLRKYDQLGAYLEDAIEDKNTSEATRLKTEMGALETKINNYERGNDSFSYSIGGL